MVIIFGVDSAGVAALDWVFVQKLGVGGAAFEVLPAAWTLKRLAALRKDGLLHRLLRLRDGTDWDWEVALGVLRLTDGAFLERLPDVVHLFNDSQLFIEFVSSQLVVIQGALVVLYLFESQFYTCVRLLLALVLHLEFWLALILGLLGVLLVFYQHLVCRIVMQVERVVSDIQMCAVLAWIISILVSSAFHRQLIDVSCKHRRARRIWTST